MNCLWVFHIPPEGELGSLLRRISTEKGRIAALRVYRQCTGCDWKRAKEVLDRVEGRYPDALLYRFEEVGHTLKFAGNIALWRHLWNHPVKTVVVVDSHQYLQFGGLDRKSIVRLPTESVGTGRPKFVCPEEMCEFYRGFNGLKESFPDGTFGVFDLNSEPSELQTRLEEENGIALREVLDYPVIFRAVDGDLLLKDPSHAFIWFNLELHTLVRHADSFSELVTKYIEHRLTSGGVPFTCYA